MSGTARDAKFGVLERRLFFIMLSALLPVVLLSYFLLFEEAQSKKQNTVEAARNLMRTTITAVDFELENSISALDALAASPRLKANDFSGFRQEVREFLAHRSNWANVVLSSPDAQQLINAKLPVGTPLQNKLDPKGTTIAASTKQAHIGAIIFSPIFHEYVFVVQVPVKRNNNVIYILSAVIKLNAVQNLVNRTGLPSGSVLTILDSEYKAIARSMNPADWVGKPASESLLRLIRQGTGSDAAITTTLEGKPVYTIIERSRLSHWTAAIGIPVEMIDGPPNRLYGMLALGILISAGLGLLVAHFIGRSIANPVKDLEKAAISIGNGERPEVPRTSIAEISKVGEALVSAYYDREAALVQERQARESAENANKAKDEFLAMLSHELRNPLAPIHGVAQLLKMPGLNKERIESLAATIERQTNHLVRLVNDLLEASRVTRKLIVLQKDAIDVRATLDEALEQVSSRVKRGGHELIVSCAADSVYVLADRARLVQIFVNLLDNAVKYTPENGKIAVTVTPDVDVVRITVKDNGIGMPAELLPSVFDLFRQSERSLDRHKGGLGIGLSIVKSLVELHGGRIRARSDGRGKGSEFEVELTRIAKIRSSGLANDQEFWARDGKNLKVVIVDDNKDAATTISLYLTEKYGCAVSEFTDSAIALEKISEAVPDVCILDIGMPGMDGFTLARRLKSYQALNQSLFIALSGYGSPQDKQKAFAAGFDQHFTKPVDIDELASFIIDAVEKRRQALQAG